MPAAYPLQPASAPTAAGEPALQPAYNDSSELQPATSPSPLDTPLPPPPSMLAAPDITASTPAAASELADPSSVESEQFDQPQVEDVVNPGWNRTVQLAASPGQDAPFKDAAGLDESAVPAQSAEPAETLQQLPPNLEDPALPAQENPDALITAQAIDALAPAADEEGKI